MGVIFEHQSGKDITVTAKMSGRRKSHPYKIMSEEYKTTMIVHEEQTEDEIENISDVSSEHSDNSVEYTNHPEESRWTRAYRMMLMKIFLSMNEQTFHHTVNPDDFNVPLDLSRKPQISYIPQYQNSPVDLSSPPILLQQNIIAQNNKTFVNEIQGKLQPRKQVIKRPMNAFMIWAQTERRNLQILHPELDNCSISKMLGRRWREMEGAEKQFYYDQQAALAKLHMQEYPGYKYTPRQKRVCVLAGKKVTVAEFKQWNRRKREEDVKQMQPLNMF